MFLLHCIQLTLSVAYWGKILTWIIFRTAPLQWPTYRKILRRSTPVLPFPDWSPVFWYTCQSSWEFCRKCDPYQNPWAFFLKNKICLITPGQFYDSTSIKWVYGKKNGKRRCRKRTCCKKVTSLSCRLDSSQLGSEFFNIITASSTISTLAGGLVNDLISVRSFLFNASRAWAKNIRNWDEMKYRRNKNFLANVSLTEIL